MSSNINTFKCTVTAYWGFLVGQQIFVFRPSKSFFVTSSGSTSPVKHKVEGQNRLLTHFLIKFSLQIQVVQVSILIEWWKIGETSVQ